MADITALFGAAPKAMGTVEVGGHAVEISPVSLASLVRILRRYPAAVKVLFGGGDVAETLVGCGPEMIAALLAAATGHEGEPEVERRIADLPEEWQADLLAEAVRLTLPDGRLDAFLARLARVGEAMGLKALPQP